MDEEIAKRRLLTLTGIRLCCLLFVFLGLTVIYTDFVRRGGWPQLGAGFCVAGALAFLLIPRATKRSWDREDREGQ
jgi:hypothetical protein